VITQILWLLILSIPVASIAWTVTHEEVFREPREFCKQQSETAPGLWKRKLYYLFTCEFCFSHYVAAGILLLTRFKLLYPDLRGYVISLFALVWVANFYMAAFANLRLDIHHERVEIQSKDLDVKSKAERLNGERAA
jgi:hypothetical protein